MYLEPYQYILLFTQLVNGCRAEQNTQVITESLPVKCLFRFGLQSDYCQPFTFSDAWTASVLYSIRDKQKVTRRLVPLRSQLSYLRGTFLVFQLLQLLPF